MANMPISEYVRAARAVWPLLKSSLLRGQLFRPACELTEPHPDVLVESNVRIPMAEGFYLTANVFRPRSGGPVPVVMCAHPYNNQLLPALGKTPFGGAPQQYRIIRQAGRPRFSKLTSWESPDPNFWIPAGYAVVNLNLPGYGTSQGPPTVFTQHQARCYAEAIEWAAAQPWSTGRVGLNGVSYLAITQWHVAGWCPPPALRCISPWEGLSDMYRDQACPGGVGDDGFGPFWWITEVKPALSGGREAFLRHNGALPMDFLAKHPLFDDFWREKAAPVQNITVPMLVCASFSDHGLHTVGSFRGFEQARSQQKWLYTHRWGKWDVYYDPAIQQLTREFMDCFLKDDPTFLQRAPVRLEVRSSRGVVHAVRDEREWPLARTVYTKLFLGPHGLSETASGEAHEIAYPARRGRVAFRIVFDRSTELTGYMKLRLWVSARGSDDMLLFVAVDKIDGGGRSVRFMGSVGNQDDMVTRGFCRVSRRELDPAASTDWHPVPTGASHLPLRPGEIVPVDIELYPSSTFFAAGEGLDLIVSSNEIIPSPPYIKDLSGNRGDHVLHVGGEWDAHLLVPVVPS